MGSTRCPTMIEIVQGNGLSALGEGGLASAPASVLPSDFRSLNAIEGRLAVCLQGCRFRV